MSRYDIAQSYMVFGGIPYYMGYLEPGMSLAQNIDAAFFAKGAKLHGEFDRLFDSVFVSPDAVKSIVRLLYTRNAGFTRREIAEKLSLPDGGSLSRNLNALVASEIPPKMSVHNTLITTFGLVRNKYSGVFSNVVTLDDLFA